MTNEGLQSVLDRLRAIQATEERHIAGILNAKREPTTRSVTAFRLATSGIELAARSRAIEVANEIGNFILKIQTEEAKLGSKAVAIVLALALMLPGIGRAGDDCHISAAVPIVTDWTITGGAGKVVIDAKLATRAGFSPAETYFSEGDAWWWHYLYIRPANETRQSDDIDCSRATVTDSTFHFEFAWPPGRYAYVAAINGDYLAESDRCDPYVMIDTLTIKADGTPARRASLGALKARYAR